MEEEQIDLGILGRMSAWNVSWGKFEGICDTIEVVGEV